MSSDNNNNDDQSQDGSLAPYVVGGLFMYWMFSGSSGDLPKAGRAHTDKSRYSPSAAQSPIPRSLGSTSIGRPWEVIFKPFGRIFTNYVEGNTELRRAFLRLYAGGDVCVELENPFWRRNLWQSHSSSVRNSVVDMSSANEDMSVVTGVSRPREFLSQRSSHMPAKNTADTAADMPRSLSGGRSSRVGDPASAETPIMHQRGTVGSMEQAERDFSDEALRLGEAIL